MCLMEVAAFMRKDQGEFLSEAERDELRDRRGYADSREVQPSGFFETDLDGLSWAKVCRYDR